MGVSNKDLLSLAMAHDLDSRHTHLSEEQKHEVLTRFLVNHESFSQLSKEFNVCTRTIQRLISNFASGKANYDSSNTPVVQPSKNPTPMPRKNPNPVETPEQELERLRRENAKLQEALKMAEWSNHAKDVMIDIAEQTFNIPIRKKSGAKQ